MLKVTPITTRLLAFERTDLEAHFIALGPEDRRLRFGASLGDDALSAYVARIDFERDRVFAVRDGGTSIVAAVHVAVAGRNAELGLSVLPGFRGCGLGSALFSRAVFHLRNRGIHEVFAHCISENAAMLHLARKHGMRVLRHGSESDARLALMRLAATAP
jgi:RimJ/RimL family protein N-acetyltransferase